MSQVTFNKNVYLYGDFGTDKIIIYAQPFSEKSRTISSLEGFFISEIPFIKKGTEKGITKDWQPIFRKDQIKQIENKYQGKFIQF